MKTSDRSLARGEQPCCGWRWSNACWKKINSATKEGTFWLYDGCSQSIFLVQAAGAARLVTLTAADARWGKGQLWQYGESLFFLMGFLLGGCMQATTSDRPPPVSDAKFTARDRRELANPPYRRASISHTYQRQIVRFHRQEAPGSILVDRCAFSLLRAPGRQGDSLRGNGRRDSTGLSGVAVGRKPEWPGWTPTETRRRMGPLPNYWRAGRTIRWARAGLPYSDDKDTIYRIHGTNQPQ